MSEQSSTEKARTPLCAACGTSGAECDRLWASGSPTSCCSGCLASGGCTHTPTRPDGPILPHGTQPTERQWQIAERDEGPTSEQFVRTFDLHVEILRANRRLDAAYPPYRPEDFEAIYERATSLREHVTALIDHLDQMRTPPGPTTAGDD